MRVRFFSSHEQTDSVFGLSFFMFSTFLSCHSLDAKLSHQASTNDHVKIYVVSNHTMATHKINATWEIKKTMR